MSQSNRVRWGVIGLGWFGEVHADNLAEIPEIELAALCTRRPERLNEIGERLGVNRLYTDYRELLADTEIDVVSITTHINDHRDIAIDALRSGKHVLLEKPMAPTVADCEQIVEVANNAKGFFMVGHICRFDPRVTIAKQAIDEGRIGKIISMHARRNLSKAIGQTVLDDISALMGDGIHDADLMLWFSQANVSTVYAQEVHPGQNKFPDGGWSIARLDNGAVAVVESVWHLPESTPYAIDARLEVIGTEGALYINCGEAGLTIHDAQGVKMPDTMYWPRPFGNYFGVLKEELCYFANCVRNNEVPKRITPAESCAAVAWMEAATESAQTGSVLRF
ncbi:Gfo/Idh/MocA family protein [Gimesia aquarii]|uniref:Inositol 2-dehydrogenase n=1 Tax=Gimesia aquarii TaxID=2527964 RepID=A0A517X1W8_9PLAN|nr:Gfo/Idh/MocA family oxidoreductase [Gimesia aquarii]QDU11496.1 Inositol 2-dehydrogenase [Gimesia aquarii]